MSEKPSFINQLSLPVIDCELKVDVQNDILKVAAIDRIHNSGKHTICVSNAFFGRRSVAHCSPQRPAHGGRAER